MELRISSSLCILLIVFIGAAECIVHPYCPRGEVPVISLTRANFSKHDHDYFVGAEHFDAITAVWKVKAAENSRNIGSSFVNLPGDFAGIHSDTSLTKFGHNHTFASLTIQGYESAMVDLVTTNGEYDITLSSTFKMDEINLKSFIAKVMNAPPKEIVLIDGERKKITLSSVWGPSFTIVSQHILKRNHSTGKKFDHSFDSYRDKEILEEEKEQNREYSEDQWWSRAISPAESQDSDEGTSTSNRVVTVEMIFEHFEHQRDSGYYCLVIEGRQTNSFTVKVQACTLITTNEGTCEKSITMETCSWQNEERLMSKAAVKVNTRDCIICSTTGYNETILLMKRENQWRILSSDKQPVNQPPSTVRRSIVHLDNVNDNMNGNYVCIGGNGIDGGDVSTQSLEISTHADIYLVTYYRQHRRTRYAMSVNGYYQRLTQSGYNITCSTINGYEEPIFLSLWMEVQDGKLDPFTDQSNNCFISETKPQESNTKIEGFFVPKFRSSECAARINVVTIHCKVQTDWLTKFTNVDIRFTY